MSEYLTIKQACQLTGKSDKTIRNNFTSKKEEINKLTSKDVIIKKGREYGILKSYVLDFYQLETGKLLVSSGNETDKKGIQTGKLLVSSSNETGKHEELLVTLRNELKDSKLNVEYFKNKLDEEGKKTEKLINQNNQSQILIADLQKTNKTLQLGERENKQAPKIKEENKENPIWMMISLLIIITTVIMIYFTFYK